MTGAKNFLEDKVAKCDLVMAQIAESPKPQCFIARVERVFSARKGVDATSLGRLIEFVGSSPNWGQTSLTVGDVALVFL